jgi:hypothetical protein
MNNAQLEQLKQMSPAGRTSHYLKKLIAKEITRQQYDDILEVVLQLPYAQIVPQGSEILPDSGEQRGRMDSTTVRFHSESSGHGEETTDAVGENTDTPPVECTSEIFVSGFTNDKPVDRQSGEKGDKSQKQLVLELLSDGEWHTNIEIIEKCYNQHDGGYCNYKARIDELRNEYYKIPNAERITGKIFRYRLLGRSGDAFDEKVKDIATLFSAG